MPVPKGRAVYAVIGAGHGGQAVAAYLAAQGHRVRLFNKSFERVRPVLEAGGIQLEGMAEGFGRLECATTDAAEAVRDAHTVMVIVPASAHRAVAHRLAPHLRPGQVVVLNPGRTGGAFEFEYALHKAGNPADVTVAEAQSFFFASRVTGPACVTIYGVKKSVPLAALPAVRTPETVELLQRAFPQLLEAPSVLATSFDNIGAIFHPGPTLLNAARIESTGGDFDYYREGITPSVAAILEQLDDERLRIARAYGVWGMPAREWLRMAYGCEGSNLYEAIQNNPGYRGIKAPASLNHRYLFEDVPASLVPLASLGRLAGIPVPTFDTLIDLAERVTGRDYHATGRSLERMGLAASSVEKIVARAEYGDRRREMTG